MVLPRAPRPNCPDIHQSTDHVFVTRRGREAARSAEAFIQAEQSAHFPLLAGAFGWVRNPASHRDLPVDDVTHAMEQLMLASLLLRIADERVAARAPASSALRQ